MPVRPQQVRQVEEAALCAASQVVETVAHQDLHGQFKGRSAVTTHEPALQRSLTANLLG